MHGATSTEQFVGWLELEKRLSLLNLNEETRLEQVIQYPRNWQERTSVFDSKIIPSATETAFAQCTTGCTDAEINDFLNFIHDENFDRSELRWKTAAAMKTYFKRTARRLGNLEVQEVPFQDRKLILLFFFFFLLFYSSNSLSY